MVRWEYLGVVYGSFKIDSGIINLFIGCYWVDCKKMVVILVERGGKIVVIYWEVKECLGNFFMILFCLEIGWIY